jgi:hypothetical protein
VHRGAARVSHALADLWRITPAQIDARGRWHDAAIAQALMQSERKTRAQNDRAQSLLLVNLAVIVNLLLVVRGAGVAASRLGSRRVSLGTVVMARFAAVGGLRCRSSSGCRLSGRQRCSASDESRSEDAGRDHGGLLWSWSG